jgi:hypothetical protein
MPHLVLSRSAVGACAAAALLTSLALAEAASAQTTGPSFSCRASAVRLATGAPLPTLLVEPVVANAPDVPCVAASQSTVPPTVIGPLAAGALSATTTTGPAGATASTRVADLGLDLGTASTLALPLLPPVQLPSLLPVALRLGLINSTAGYSCQNGQPVPSGASEVVGLALSVLGLNVPINLPNPSQPVDLDLGILTIHLNQQVVTANTIMQRAVYINAPGLGIELAVAESRADISGNPCGPAAVVPPAVVPTPPIRIDVPVAGRPTGVAGLVGAPAAGSCSRRPFTLRVRGRGIATVAFTVGGRPLAGSGASVRVDPARFSIGAHRLLARVTFTAASRTPARTLATTFRRCAAAEPAASPRFTG